jgi:hypothetical protein
MRVGRNQSGFSRRGAEAPVPSRRKAPDESGAEKAWGVAAPDAVRPLSVFLTALFLGVTRDALLLLWLL